MIMIGPIRSLSIVVLSIGFWLGGVAHATCDFQAAAALTDKARRSADAKARLDLAQRSIAVCPTFMAYYVVGRTQMDLHRLGPARAAFELARLTTNERRYRALALGRLGEVEKRLGHTATARAMLEQAYRQLDGKRPPWLLEARRDVDQALAHRLVSAKEIATTLTMTRAFSVAGVAQTDLRVHFAHDSDELEVDGSRQVRELGLALLEVSGEGAEEILVIGHTDTTGDPDYNQRLSKRRAQRVVDQLAHDVPSLRTRLVAQGRGEREPLYLENSDEAHRLNRRVEITIP